MSKTIPFNINSTVRVRVNERGEAHLLKRHVEQFGDYLDKFPYRPKATDENGYSRWQLWDLMQSFEGCIHLGCHMPYDPEILMEVSE